MHAPRLYTDLVAAVNASPLATDRPWSCPAGCVQHLAARIHEPALAPVFEAAQAYCVAEAPLLPDTVRAMSCEAQAIYVLTGLFFMHLGVTPQPVAAAPPPKARTAVEVRTAVNVFLSQCLASGRVGDLCLFANTALPDAVVAALVRLLSAFIDACQSPAATLLPPALLDATDAHWISALIADARGRFSTPEARLLARVLLNSFASGSFQCPPGVQPPPPLLPQADDPAAYFT